MVSIAIPNMADQLQSLIQSDTAQAAVKAKRAPMIFSSLKRKYDAGLVDFTTQNFGGPPTLAQLTARNFIQNNKLYAAQTGTVKPFVVMAVNPKSIRFAQPKRIARVDGVGGTKFHHFTNADGQDNDILTITFQGNTGNLDRRGSLASPERLPGALQSGPAIDQKELASQDTGALNKLLIWHNLYLLTREPKVFKDRRTGQLIENKFYVTYASALFPLQIVFTGHYGAVMEFGEEGSKPGSRDYTMQFVAESSDPSLDEFIRDLGLLITAAQAQPAQSNLLGVGTNFGL